MSTIDSITPYYDDNYNGQLDEGKSIRIEGHVTDPGIYDGMTVTVLIDWNGDGDTDDEGEQILASVWGGYGSDWYFEAYVYVPDDGPSGAWSNGTPQDSLTVKAKAEDGHGGTDEASDTVTVYNVPVTFSGDPSFSFSYDEDGNVTSVTISASFHDPGFQDRHRATISYGDGFSEIIDIPFGDRWFSTTRDFSPGESIEVVLPIDFSITDDDETPGSLSLDPGEYTVQWGDELTGNILANGSDSSGAPLAAVQLSTPPDAELTISSDGTFSFRPSTIAFPDRPILAQFAFGLQPVAGQLGGFARGGARNVPFSVLAALTGHVMASAAFSVRTAGALDADTLMLRIPTLFSPFSVSPADNISLIQVGTAAPQADNDGVLANVTTGDQNGGVIATSGNFIPVGATTFVPQASSTFNTNIFAGAPSGQTTSAADYLVVAPIGMPVNIDIQIFVNAGSTTVAPTDPDRVAADPHWMYAEVTNAGAPGTGTFFFGVFTAATGWVWAQAADDPSDTDVIFAGFGLPTTGPGFSLNHSILTTAGALGGDIVTVYTAVGWDMAVPAGLGGLLAGRGQGGFIAAPGPIEPFVINIVPL
jgi:hypothetical protein